jgi:hypothetical protein
MGENSHNLVTQAGTLGGRFYKNRDFVKNTL